MDSVVKHNINKCLVIAEIANTHNGSAARAENLVKMTATAKADAIKFQYFQADDLVTSDHPEYGTFKSLELRLSTWQNLFFLSHQLGLLALCDVFSVAAVDILVKLGCDGFKIHSSDIGNAPLLSRLGETGLPLLLSLGGTTPRDTWLAVNKLRASGARAITLMLGFQAFPTQLADSKLRLIQWYAREFDLPVGYADHTDAESPMALIAPLLAIAQGASVIEKHITYDRAGKPDDYESAIEPDKFALLVDYIRDTQTALGSEDFSTSGAELAYSRRMKKYPLATRTLLPGEIIGQNDVIFRRIPDSSEAFPGELEDILGKSVRKTIPMNSPIPYNHLTWKIALLIAVRSASTRLPHKAFAEISGKPAILWLIERVKYSRRVSKIILCTTTLPEDDRFVQIASQCGVSIFRGAETDVMDRFIGAAESVDADIIVRVTGDDLLSDPIYIDKAIDHHLQNNAEYTYVSGLPLGVDREVILVRALKWVHQHARNLNHTEYMSWYLDSPLYLRVATLKADTRHWRPQYSLTLDTYEDLQFIRWVFEQLYRSQVLFTLEEVIDLLDAHPEIALRDTKLLAKVERRDVDTHLELH